MVNVTSMPALAVRIVGHAGDLRACVVVLDGPVDVAYPCPACANLTTARHAVQRLS
jgi:hypothetical protein